MSIEAFHFDEANAVDIGRKARELVDEAEISTTYYYEDGEADGYMVLVPAHEWEALVAAVNSHAQEASDAD